MGDLQSIATAKLLYCLGEGKWKGLVNGLQSVFFDGVPYLDIENKCNFKEGGIAINEDSFRWGTITQNSIGGFSASEKELADGREVTKAGGPKVISISDLTVDSVRVTMGFPLLTETFLTSNNVNGALVSYTIGIRSRASGASPDYVTVIEGSANGKALARYQISHLIDLKNKLGTGPWDIQITRITDDSANVTLLNNKSYIDNYTEIIDDKLSHPGAVMASVMFDSKVFGSAPAISFECDMLEVAVPNNYTPGYWTPATKTVAAFWTPAVYTGPWTGVFSATKVHTSNPAWALFDLLTNVDYGLGRWIKAPMVNKWALYKIAQYCDGLVESGKLDESLQPILEPRFTCNVYLATREQAYKVIENLCSVFRGMSYWASGSVWAVDDSPAVDVFEYTCANVTEKGFNYSTPERRQKHNVALVAWNDPADGYAQKIEYVQDLDAILQMGQVYESDLVAFGCTSQGQAHRFGRAILFTERFGEMVSFQTGFEGLRARPGDPILVGDQFREKVRLAGRVVSSDGTHHVLDSAVVLEGDDSISMVLPDGSLSTQKILSMVGATATTAPLAMVPLPMSQWIVTNANHTKQRYRVYEVKEDSMDLYTINALFEDENKWAYIEDDLSISVANPPNLPPQPGSNTAIKNLSLYSYTYVEGGTITRTAIHASWDSGTLNTTTGFYTPLPGTTFKVEWHKGEDSWFTEPITSQPGIEIRGVEVGTYTVRVYSMLNGISSPAVSGSIVIADATSDVDDWLSPTQKHEVKSNWDIIIGEQSDLDARAITAGVSSTLYDAAIDALTTFLNTQIGVDGWEAGNWKTDKAWFIIIPPPETMPNKGGGIALRLKFTEVYTQRAALLSAILAVASQPSDVFRPAVVWVFNSTNLDCSFTMGSGATGVTGSAAAIPQSARLWTFGASHTPFTTPASPAVAGISGGSGRIVMARVRVISGVWKGNVHFKGTDVATFSDANYRQGGAPQVGGNFADIAWDMASLTVGGTSYISAAAITNIALDLMEPGGVCEIAWAALGTYGAGSLADYNAALAEVATTAMMNADWLSGGKFDGVNILDGSIITPALGAGVIFTNNLYVADTANLIPNGNSEGIMPAGGWPANSVESSGLSSVNPYRGSSHRRKTSTDLVVSGPIPVVAGEVFSFMAYAMGTAVLKIQYSTNSGVSWGTAAAPTPQTTGGAFSGTFAAYTLVGSTFAPTLGANTHFRAVLSGTGTVDYDDLYLRRTLNAEMVVDGSVQAASVKAGAIQAYHLAVGPNYQFKNGTVALAANADGSFNSINSSVEWTDGFRYYPSTINGHYEAQFSVATSYRGLILGSVLVRHRGSTLEILGINSENSYSAALRSVAVAAPDGTNSKLTVAYYASALDDALSPGAPIVLKVWLNGVPKLTATAAQLGAYLPYGYAGIYLDSNALKVWGIAMGSGSVVIENGVITADALNADLAVLNVVRSSNFTAGTASSAPVGFKLAGTAFDTRYIGSSGTASCQFELGDNANFGGYEVATVSNKLFNSVATSTVNTNSYVNTTTTQKHCGLALMFTPSSTGKIILSMSGTVLNATANDGTYRQMRYGTGTLPPSSGATATGTAIGTARVAYSVVANAHVGFTSQAIISGLTPGVEYWADLVIWTTTAGTSATLYDGVDFVAQEV